MFFKIQKGRLLWHIQVQRVLEMLMKLEFFFLDGHLICIFPYVASLIVGGDSRNANQWVLNAKMWPWKLAGYIEESHET